MSDGISKQMLADTAARYGAPIGAPETIEDVGPLSRRMLRGMAKFFMEDLMLGPATEAGDATLTGNQDLIRAGKRKQEAIDQYLGVIE